MEDELKEFRYGKVVNPKVIYKLQNDFEALHVKTNIIQDGFYYVLQFYLYSKAEFERVIEEYKKQQRHRASNRTLWNKTGKDIHEVMAKWKEDHPERAAEAEKERKQTKQQETERLENSMKRIQRLWVGNILKLRLSPFQGWEHGFRHCKEESTIVEYIIADDNHLGELGAD